MSMRQIKQLQVFTKKKDLKSPSWLEVPIRKYIMKRADNSHEGQSPKDFHDKEVIQSQKQAFYDVWIEGDKQMRPRKYEFLLACTWVFVTDYSFILSIKATGSN